MGLKRLTADEKSRWKEKLEAEEKGITNKLDGAGLVVDVLQASADLGGPSTGDFVYGNPKEMVIIFDFTGARGSGSNIYHSIIYQMPKWRYTVVKVDESIMVSPVYVEYYERTLAQREKIEGMIKTGLASAAQSVADYELIKHDYRRYKEILDYFKIAKKTGDDHVLRNLFIDRVDSYTGEGFSLVTMAKRWPTIITDFIRMKSEWGDIDEIRQKLDVSQAEATVLKTKNQLYKEWAEIFLPDIKERFARIETMMRARSRSVYEYKNWLKPYISKFKAMVDVGEKVPSRFVSDAYVTPGFGQSEAMTTTRLWIWKSFAPEEMGKPAMEMTSKRAGWRIDPYDDTVKKWQKRIEYKYGVKFTEKDVDKVLKDAITKPEGSDIQKMYPEDLYYVVFDVKFELNLLKTPPPEGFETDNLMFAPIKTWMISQNMLLIHLLEIKAREAAIENYINEIIGAKEIEEEVISRVEEEFKGEKREEKEPSMAGLRTSIGKFKKRIRRASRYFFKTGPYEVMFFERLSKMYFRAAGADYGKFIEFVKKNMKVE